MSKTDSTIHIYCSQAVRVKLEQLAKANHRTLSSEVQALIEKAFAEMFKTTFKNLKE